MNAVVIFDVSQQEEKVRERMRAVGYYTAWGSGQPATIYNLPKNVVWKLDTDAQQALKDINQVITSINAESFMKIPGVVLKRCIILNSTPFGGITGEAL